MEEERKITMVSSTEAANSGIVDTAPSTTTDGRRSSTSTASSQQQQQPPSPRDIKGKRKAKRKEKEMECKQKAAFHRLPREIIQQILYLCDPNTFDSLTLLNSDWYRASRSCHLYARQLQNCNIHVTVELDDRPETLSSLVYQFGVEARRGTFESMLRPKVTELQLICNSLSSSIAPGGEAFRYEFSPKGTFVLAISSSRLFVIDLSTPSGELPVTVKRELKLMRRPNAAAILDDGSMMVVQSSPHKVSLYDLSGTNVKMVKSMDLENEPRTIALSPGAAVLALAYEGGVEVISLGGESLGLGSSRSVKCETVDSLFFSLDGTVLMGSTLSSQNPVTVVISAPFFSQDMPVSELLSQMWTTQILFPRSSRDNSHATLLPHAGESSSWTVTYDKVFASFRAVRVDDLRNGYTYFTAPATDSLPPSTLPAPSNDGGIVAAGFGSRSVFIYGVPSSLENTGEENGSGHISSNSSNSSSHDRDLDLGATHTPQWQHVASDRTRSVIVNGKKIGDVEGLAGVKFSKSERGERLVAVAAGVDNGEVDEEGNPLPLNGGRIVFFDFVRGPNAGEKNILSIEVGDGSLVPLEKLEERQMDLEAEVSIVRRRTVAARGRGGRGGHATHNVDIPAVPTTSLSRAPSAAVRPNASAAVAASRSMSPSQVIGAPDDGSSEEEEQEALDLPYSHDNPRSQTTLQRAATAAAATAARTPRRRPEAANEPSPSVTNYRLLGLREEPWIEPPPPYSEGAVTTVLYDYHERLAERAATMGIPNPDTRVQMFSPSAIERSNTAPDLNDDGSPRSIGRSGSTRSIANRAGSLIRRNAPSLRITSPVSPVNSAFAGEVSMGGSVSAGAGPPSQQPFVNPAFQHTAAVTRGAQTPGAGGSPRGTGLHPPRSTSLAPHSAGATVPSHTMRDLPPVPSGPSIVTVQSRVDVPDTNDTGSPSSSPPRRRNAPEPYDTPREHVRSTRVPQPQYMVQSGTRSNDTTVFEQQPPQSSSSSRPTTSGSNRNIFSVTPATPILASATTADRDSPTQHRPSPPRDRPSMMSRLPSHRVSPRQDTFANPLPSMFPPDMGGSPNISQPHLPPPPQPFQQQQQQQQQQSSIPPIPPQPQINPPSPPQPRHAPAVTAANYSAPLPPIPQDVLPERQHTTTRLASRRSTSRRNRRSINPYDPREPYINPQFMDTSSSSSHQQQQDQTLPLTPANLNLANVRHLHASSHSPTPSFGSSGIRRSPAGSYGHGSVRRNPSRAERSAARNVRDMKAKKKAASRALAAGSRGLGGGSSGDRGVDREGKREGGKGMCVVM